MACPIHPEMFDRLYNDWSTLDKFQRTRGVLRPDGSNANPFAMGTAGQQCCSLCRAMCR